MSEIDTQPHGVRRRGLASAGATWTGEVSVYKVFLSSPQLIGTHQLDHQFTHISQSNPIMKTSIFALAASLAMVSAMPNLNPLSVNNPHNNELSNACLGKQAGDACLYVSLRDMS